MKILTNYHVLAVYKFRTKHEIYTENKKAVFPQQRKSARPFLHRMCSKDDNIGCQTTFLHRRIAKWRNDRFHCIFGIFATHFV